MTRNYIKGFVATAVEAGVPNTQITALMKQALTFIPSAPIAKSLGKRKEKTAPAVQPSAAPAVADAPAAPQAPGAREQLKAALMGLFEQAKGQAQQVGAKVKAMPPSHKGMMAGAAGVAGVAGIAGGAALAHRSKKKKEKEQEKQSSDRILRRAAILRALRT
jgi:hypothetical protein